MIELRDWADQVILDLDKFGPIRRLEDDGDWQTWGTQFQTISGLSQKNPPDPRFFNDWREWATRLYGVLS
jgi:hypothetical protein